ncbi:MAG: hypothetical protein JNM93_14060 [Bacteriovoracaceae bacterium]|nr:hypothetical protein [Bacteriovoracaceae bacterium]
MKVALIGLTPHSLETALLLHEQEANLVLFNSKPAWGRGVEELSLNATWEELTSQRGREILKAGFDLKRSPCVGEYLENYFYPLKEYLSNAIQNISHEIVRVSKRSIALDEEIENHTRLHDLFRIVFKVIPSPETIALLAGQEKELISSLETSYESFLDFDVVIDSDFKAGYLGNNTLAIGEAQMASEAPLYYGANAVTQLEQSETEVALVGSGLLAAQFIIKNENWLNAGGQLYLVSHEAVPFQALLKNHSETNTKLKKILEKNEQEYLAAQNTYLQKLNEWRELDDFVQAKISEPSQPVPKIVIFAGHNVMAINQLSDRKGKVFLTLELPEFRKVLVQKENGERSLKTISVDKVFALTGNQRNLDKYQGLRLESYNRQLCQTELGLYFLGSKQFHENHYDCKNIHQEIEVLLQSLLQYFYRS